MFGIDGELTERDGERRRVIPLAYLLLRLIQRICKDIGENEINVRMVIGLRSGLLRSRLITKRDGVGPNVLDLIWTLQTKG